MPNYFGTLSRIAGTEGCSASPTEADGSRPSDNTMAKCKIYGNIYEEMGRSDSCFNVIALDAVVCPQSDAKKLMVDHGTGQILPMIFKCSYIPRNGSSNSMPVECMDPARAIQFATQRNYPSKDAVISDINSANNIQFCNGSKAFYVDRAITGANVPRRANPSTGFVMSGPNIQGTLPVQKVAKVEGKTVYLAQQGDLIIMSHATDLVPVGDRNYPNGISGALSYRGKISDYDISTDLGVQDMFNKLKKTARVLPLGYRVSQAPTDQRTRLQKATDLASKAASLAKQKASQAGSAALNRASAAASKVGRFFRR
jgi:hypothetical protein